MYVVSTLLWWKTNRNISREGGSPSIVFWHIAVLGSLKQTLCITSPRDPGQWRSLGPGAYQENNVTIHQRDRIILCSSERQTISEVCSRQVSQNIPLTVKLPRLVTTQDITVGWPGQLVIFWTEKQKVIPTQFFISSSSNLSPGSQARSPTVFGPKWHYRVQRAEQGRAASPMGWGELCLKCKVLTVFQASCEKEAPYKVFSLLCWFYLLPVCPELMTLTISR